ncbi:MAG TPA: PilN domain-containing protein [Terriglobales bacterium]|nr:PilN domain-containing protein [Terriglobales bacterium]
MIRINLLGVTSGKKGKRAAVAAATTTVSGGGPNMLVVLLVITALAAGGNYYYYSSLQRDAANLKIKMEEAKRENQRLADIKAKYIELEKQKDIYERRVNVIHQLQANQSGPATLLTTIGDTVNRTDAVWLNSMKDDGAAINLDGIALSVDAVAQLMKNLKATGYFKNIEIKESFQDDVVKDMTAFTFTLVCEKQPQQKS